MKLKKKNLELTDAAFETFYASDGNAEREGRCRVVTKISSCWVNTIGRRGIKRLGISFSSISLPFSNKSSRGPLS